MCNRSIHSLGVTTEHSSRKKGPAGSIDNCVYYSLPTGLVVLKNINTYVYLRGKASDYDDLLDMHDFYSEIKPSRREPCLQM